MTSKISRDEAPEMVYVVYGSDTEPVETFEGEEDAYDFAGDDERVVTYQKA